MTSIFFLTAVVCSVSNAQSLRGKATFYGGVASGGSACGFADVPSSTFPFGYHAACGGTTLNNGYGCGACFEVTCIGPNEPTNTGCSCDASTPSVTVSCMDQCPECAANHFDLDPTAMARIVGDGLSGTCGVINITYTRVDCDYLGEIMIRSKSGTSAWWYGLHVDDVAGAGSVLQVDLQSSGDAAYNYPCLKTDGYSYYLCDLTAGALTAPLSVRLTNEYGETVECDQCITSLDGDLEFGFGSNFAAISGTRSPTVATTISTTALPTVSTPTSAVPSPTGYIEVINADSTQDWYLSFFVDNVDGSSCGNTVSNVQIYYNNAWVTAEQTYLETNGLYRYGWNNFGFAFSTMLPISVRIVTSQRNIDLWSIIADLSTTSTFTSSQLICDGTLAPTSPTPAPTTSAPTTPTTPYPTAEAVCIDETSLDWRSYDNQLILNGNRFNLKGLSWFGFETTNYGLYGLDVHTVDWYLQWMVDRGFNAIRLPFSQDFMNGGTSNQAAYLSVVQKAGDYGLLVMPDFHSKTAGSYMDGLSSIKDSDGSFTTAIGVWETVADLLASEWNVFAADCYNEPHDVANAEWGDWIAFCESVANALWAKGVNWLIVIEGTNWNCPELGSSIGCAWGENLMGIGYYGITFDDSTYGANRFVWSPHVYGEEITGNTWSTAEWQTKWGYLVDGTSSNQAAIMLGEFGTKLESDTQRAWLNGLVDYLVSIDARNSFFWCLNPNSGDTGGLLQSDWTTEESEKLAILERLQANPSVITYDSSNSQVCVSFEGGNSTTTVTPAPTTSAPTTTVTAGSPTAAPSTSINPSGTSSPTTTATEASPTAAISSTETEVSDSGAFTETSASAILASMFVSLCVLVCTA